MALFAMFNVGDHIVYPMHGAGVIDAIEEKDILGEKQAYYILKMPGEGDPFSHQIAAFGER